MQADAHFIIGSSHAAAGQPCQDYALAKVLDSHEAYAIIADGCSGGGKTDIGARLVALATAQAIEQNRSINAKQLMPGVRHRQDDTFRIALSDLGLAREDLLATCGFVYVQGANKYVHVQGDGVAAWGLSNGNIQAVRIDWAENTPAYPSYRQDDFKAFLAHHGNMPAKLSLSYWHLTPDGQAYEYYRTSLSTRNGMHGVNLKVPDSASVVGVFSDGVTQVNGMDWTSAVRELMSFKTTNGEFVKRRLNRFSRDGGKSQYYPVDDLAYAAISLKEDQ